MFSRQLSSTVSFKIIDASEDSQCFQAAVSSVGNLIRKVVVNKTRGGQRSFRGNFQHQKPASSPHDVAAEVWKRTSEEAFFFFFFLNGTIQTQ